MKISKLLVFKNVIDAVSKLTDGKKTITGLITTGIGVAMLVTTGPNYDAISTTVAGASLIVTGIIHKIKKRKQQKGAKNA